MSTNLTVLNQPTSLEAAMAAGGLGLNMAQVLRPAPLILVQPTTDVVGVMPGVFLSRNDGTQFTEVQAVLLAIQQYREKYPSAEFKRGERPQCKSRDGIKPITDREDLTPLDNGGGCAACPHASWKGYNSRQKTGTKPTCRDKRRLIFIEKTTSLPFFMSVQGTAVKTIKMLEESIIRNAIMQNAKFKAAGNPRRMNLFDYAVTLVSKKSNDGPYYNLTVAAVTPMAESEAQTFGPMYMDLIARRQQVEDEIEASTSAPEGEGGSTIEGESVPAI